MKHLKNLVMAGVLTLTVAAAGAAPMGGKMSMSDQKMMPGMMKGVPTSDHPMMMKMCRLMMPAMSARDKKAMMGMSPAEKQMCMNMCKTMMPDPKPMTKKPIPTMGKM